MPVEQLAQPADVLAAWPAYGLLPATEQTALLNAASRKILGFCRRTQFLQLMDTELLNGNGLPRLWLRRRPVIVVAAITINGDPVVNTSGLAWSFTPRTGELLLGSGHQDKRFSRRFPHGRQNVAVEYWAGYSTIPYDVNRACIWCVKWMSEQGEVSGIYSSERIGDWNGTLNAAAFSMTLPTHIASLLADYVQDDGPL